MEETFRERNAFQHVGGAYITQVLQCELNVLETKPASQSTPGKIENFSLHGGFQKRNHNKEHRYRSLHVIFFFLLLKEKTPVIILKFRITTVFSSVSAPEL